MFLGTGPYVGRAVVARQSAGAAVNARRQVLDCAAVHQLEDMLHRNASLERNA